MIRLCDWGLGYRAVVNDHTRQLDELSIVTTSGPPTSNGLDPSYDDRRGRLVVVGLVMALLFLLIAGLLWWVSDPDGDASEALEPAVAPVANPTVLDTSPGPSAASTLPVSSYPMPAKQAVPASAATAAPVAPVAPASAAPIAQLVSVTTTTTTLPPTTTTTTARAVAPAPTLAPTTTVVTTVAPSPAPTTTAATTAATATAATTTTVEQTTTVPPTTAAGPVVTSPADPHATLLDVIESTPDLSRLRELVDLSGLQPELADPAPRTFFAPGNDAIAAYAASAQGATVLADPELVHALLLRHLVPEALDQPAIFSVHELETMSGDTLTVRQGSQTVDGADLLVVDVTAANGYLHVVSDVLVAAS